MQLHNKKYLEPYRKSLRKKLTPAEAFLWRYLKAKKLEGRKFRRQHSINNYILDFYCPQDRIAIELDGQQHFEPEGRAKDEKRDKVLEGLNIKVLRFENRFVFEHLNTVLEMIKAEFGK